MTLEERIEIKRPPMWLCLLAAFGVWTFVGISLHLVADWANASDRTREVFNDLALFAAFFSVWYWRYEPVAAALRARQEETGQALQESTQ